MSSEGARVWIVPDGFIPERSTGGLESHEAICVLNTSRRDARISLTFYFEDREPVRGEGVVVPAERTRHLRTDRPGEIGGAEVPRGMPYALRVESDVPVVVQHSRMDTGQEALALMSVLGHPVER
ncbi:hypothetical protein Rxycam_00766 [Rubrobacter xylanophilus DSM 9941]|uniref:sensory rhodopsin transducer n=1 Tax=Rubrobacter xylanophilus TaxID=49319 RepID=UPI001C63EF86|nr:sensory rhodopsin transducer [Rubrobacter xylanophilus]QYJ14955.1 hypothetical protein Rxycam_00766 [Rubrobacter xylanophilus DSM 9941]